MISLNSAFDLVRLVGKILGAALINYASLFLVQLTDTWMVKVNATPFIDLSAGVAFLTILLLGTAGAIATLIALVAQYVNIDGAYWITFLAYAMSCVLIQYAVIKISLFVLGLSAELKGMTHLQLLLISAIFSVTYTLSDTFVLQQLHFFDARPIEQQALSDFLGIITCFMILKLVVLIRRRALSSAA